MIEPLTAADAGEIAQLDADLFPGNAWSGQAWQAEASQRDTDRRYLLLRADDGSPAGYAGIMRAGSDADILTVAVARDHQRRGHGTELVEALVEIARGWGCLGVFLEVAADNAAAIALYRRAGFTELGRRRHYYGRDQHAVTMRLQLREPLGSQSLAAR